MAGRTPGQSPLLQYLQPVPLPGQSPCGEQRGLDVAVVGKAQAEAQDDDLAHCRQPRIPQKTSMLPWPGHGTEQSGPWLAWLGQMSGQSPCLPCLPSTYSEATTYVLLWSPQIPQTPCRMPVAR